MLLIVCRLISITSLNISLIRQRILMNIKKTLKYILAKNLRQIRAERNISQEELAEISGYHRTYIGSIERSERNVTLETVETIAQALKLSPLNLLSEPRK